MPELVEVEEYRQLAEQALGRRIVEVFAPDAWFLKRGTTAEALDAGLTGRCFTQARRIGKLLLLDTSEDGPLLGLRFGMTGRLIVDGRIGVEGLEFASRRQDPAWDRFAVRFEDGGDLRLNDARRLGGVELEPDAARLGVEASGITYRQLTDALDGSTTALKARLMDQRRVAGLGNLLTDELLWRAGLDPAREAGGLDEAERRRLQRAIRSTVKDLTKGGGSHTGRLQVARVRGGRCPKDGAELLRRTVGGRTTYSCPVHQS